MSWDSVETMTTTLADYFQDVADAMCDGSVEALRMLLGQSAGRRYLTYDEPLLFALTYMPHSLKMPAPMEDLAEGADSEVGVISMSEFHWDLCEKAREWAEKPASAFGPAEMRDAFIAPRDAGKSTWLFKILPMWAAAHGHVKFVAAFADSGPQAKKHLSSFKRELESNQLLQMDFPDICVPLKRRGNVNVSDTQDLYQAQSGFVFAAGGADVSVLGMKVEDKRPDLLILDDLEPDEASYSEYQMEQRRGTLTDAILPLNIRARVILAGTVTMPGSITHQMVKAAAAQRGELPEDEIEDWIRTEKFRVHHYKPIKMDDDGNETSLWPEKWPMDWLNTVRHTRSFAKNYENDPLAVDGQYWTRDDFTYGSVPCAITILSVDGAVTDKKKSDFTGLAVVGATPHKPGDPRRRCEVKYAVGVKLLGKALRAKILQIIEMYPEIKVILVESNQGGELWREVMHDMPVKVVLIHNSEPKEVRAGKVHAMYQRIPTRVLHTARLQQAEENMVGFPKLKHDDIVDAIGNAVLKLLGAPKTERRSVSSGAYA
jgi:phage terminase large subunit-like protein